MCVVCICVYVCICVGVCGVYVCICACVCVCVCVFVYVCIYIIHVCVLFLQFTFRHTRTNKHMSDCVYATIGTCLSGRACLSVCPSVRLFARKYTHLSADQSIYQRVYVSVNHLLCQ